MRLAAESRVGRSVGGARTMNVDVWRAVTVALIAGAAMDRSSNPRAFVEESVASLQAQTAAHSATWHLDEAIEWSANQDEGTLTFDLPGGVRASASFQIVGTYDSR